MNKKEIISKSDFILSLGTMLSNNKEDVRNSIIESIAKTNAQFVYMHPIDNIDLKLYYTQFIKYEAGSEEGILALILNAFVKESTSDIQKYISDLDLGYISAESSAGEEEFEEAYENSKVSQFKTLIIGDDLIEHPRVENIVKLLSIIKNYTDFNLIVLDNNFEEKINSCENFDLEEIEDLKSFDGTVVYRLIEDESTDDLIASESFARIAKVANNDEVYLNYKNSKVKKSIKVDKKLHGTIAISKITSSNEEIFSNYRYKQVKIEKVDA
jgi:NADH-quinone oxidoreductase subunit F